MTDPSSAQYDYHFAAPVSFDPDVADGYMKHYLPIPDQVTRALNAAAIDRVAGRLDGRRFKRALHRRADGSLCLKFGQGWLRDAGLDVGTIVEVALGPDPNPDQVDIPEALAAAFEADPEAAHAWEMLTPGRRRTLVYGVERASDAPCPLSLRFGVRRAWPTQRSLMPPGSIMRVLGSRRRFVLLRSHVHVAVGDCRPSSPRV